MGIIESGRIVASGKVHEIVEQMGSHVQVVVRTLGALEDLRAAVAALPGVRRVEAVDGRVTFSFDHARAELPGLLRTLVSSGQEIFSFEVKDRSLESVFMDLTKGQVT